MLWNKWRGNRSESKRHKWSGSYISSELSPSLLFHQPHQPHGPSDIPWASLALSHLRAPQRPLSLSLICISLDYLLVLILQLFFAYYVIREAFSYLISKITTLLPSSRYYLSSYFIVHNTELHQTGSSSALSHCCTPTLRGYALYIASIQYIVSWWMNEWIPVPNTSFISTKNSMINKTVIAIKTIIFY